MNTCACGNPVEGKGSRCDRCASLQTLGLESDATAEQIKDTYRVLVKVWHPDRFQSDKKLKDEAENKLKAINAACVLLTSPSTKKTSRAQPRSDPPRAAQQTAEPPAPSNQPRPVAKRRLRFGWKYFAALGLFARFCIFAAVIAVSALILKVIDAQLASDPATAGVYLHMRSGFVSQLDASWRQVRDRVAGRFHDLFPRSAASSAAPALPAPAPDAPQPKQHTHPQARPAPAVHAVMPFITVGLTRDEVLATAGAPTADSNDKLVYPGAELYLKDGKVAGWKIDPAASLFRVKLWPDAPVDPDLDSFTVGSTRNDVLVVQGTPTSFSENTFGYGRSEVYFQRNRVISWKEDPTSVRLRAVRR